MLISFIAKFAALQLVLTVFLMLNFGKRMAYMMLVLALLALWILVPPYFYPKFGPDEVNCGMPVLGVTLVFWLVGTVFCCLSFGLAFLVHDLLIGLQKMIYKT